MAHTHRGIWRACGTLILVIALLSSAAAQDIRGVEKCTAEAQMDRRTGCLQANIEFLHQTMTKLQRETREKLASAASVMNMMMTERTCTPSWKPKEPETIL